MSEVERDRDNVNIANLSQNRGFILLDEYEPNHWPAAMQDAIAC